MNLSISIIGFMTSLIGSNPFFIHFSIHNFGYDKAIFDFSIHLAQIDGYKIESVTLLIHLLIKMPLKQAL